MSRRAHRYTMAVAAAALLTVPGWALGDGSGGHGFGGDHSMYFDPDSIVTVSGTLTERTGEWEPWGHGNHTGGGMSFEMRTDGGEELELMLAPIWYLEDNLVVLGEGERVTVTGSQVESYDGGRHHGGGPGHGGGGMMGRDDDHDYLIATRLEADGVTVDLRDEDGYPLWRGGDGWDGHDWFDPATVVTLTGTLEELLGLWSPWGHGNHTGSGMHYVFAGDGGESFYAMLGPWWFLEDAGVELTAGTRLAMRGSIVEAYWSGYDDRRFFIASEITVDGRTVALRDEWGYPLWHGTGWHYETPEWNSDSMGTLSGDVVRVRRRSHGRFLDRGYEIVVHARGRRDVLYVAPDWAVRGRGFRVRRGDRVRARGSLGAEGGGRYMVVQRLFDAENDRWRLRRRDGTPLWVTGAR